MAQSRASGPEEEDSVAKRASAAWQASKSLFDSVRDQISHSLSDISQAPAVTSSQAAHVHERMREATENDESLVLDAGGAKHILQSTDAEEIRRVLPTRLVLQDTWRLIYSLDRDGVSLATLYDKCHAHRRQKGSRSGYVLVVRSQHGSVFGGFVNEYFHPSLHYYGNGECFLWKCSQTPDGSLQFRAFPYTGLNDYMMFCTHDFLSIGGGDGKYGLWLDSSLEHAISSTCPAFGNDPLASELEQDRKFAIVGVEVWLVA